MDGKITRGILLGVHDGNELPLSTSVDEGIHALFVKYVGDMPHKILYSVEQGIAVSEIERYALRAKEQAKVAVFNPFWSCKNMTADKAYKFKVVSEKMMIRKIEDKFAGEPTDRIVITIEDLDGGSRYDLCAAKNRNKDGKFGSLTSQLRYLYAMKGDNLKGIIISLTKRLYIHEKFGETPGYTINIIEPGE